MAEKDWYPRILKFLEKNDYVCHSYWKKSKNKTKRIDFIDTGLGNVRIDVFGAKRTSDRSTNFQLETVGVEVKDSSRITLKNMRQAASYSNLCTRCYLAAPVKQFKNLEKKHAAELGIGLIRLKNPFDVIVESKRNTIDVDLVNQLLRQLQVVFCATCRTYKFLYDPDNLDYNGGSWRTDIFSKVSKWTYICEQCNIRFSKNARSYLLDRDIDWIWGEIEKIKNRMKRERESDDNTYLNEIEKLDDKISKIKRRLY